MQNIQTFQTLSFFVLIPPPESLSINWSEVKEAEGPHHMPYLLTATPSSPTSWLKMGKDRSTAAAMFQFRGVLTGSVITGSSQSP